MHVSSYSISIHWRCKPTSFVPHECLLVEQPTLGLHLSEELAIAQVSMVGLLAPRTFIEYLRVLVHFITWISHGIYDVNMQSIWALLCAVNECLDVLTV